MSNPSKFNSHRRKLFWKISTSVIRLNRLTKFRKFRVLILQKLQRIKGQLCWVIRNLQKQLYYPQQKYQKATFSIESHVKLSLNQTRTLCWTLEKLVWRLWRTVQTQFCESFGCSPRKLCWRKFGSSKKKKKRDYKKMCHLIIYAFLINNIYL